MAPIIEPRDVFVGDINAPVTLEEFGEYESDACAKANEVVKQISYLPVSRQLSIDMVQSRTSTLNRWPPARSSCADALTQTCPIVRPREFSQRLVAPIRHPDFDVRTRARRQQFLHGCVDGRRAAAAAAFRELADPLVDLSGPMPFVEAQQIYDPDYPAGHRYYWKSTNLPSMPADVIELAAKRKFPIVEVPQGLRWSARLPKQTSISKVGFQKSKHSKRRCTRWIGIFLIKTPTKCHTIGRCIRITHRQRINF